MLSLILRWLLGGLMRSLPVYRSVLQNLSKKSKSYNVVVNDFIYCQPGVFDHFEGFEELVKQGLINEFHPVRIKGTPMRGVTSSSDRVAGMNIVADSIVQYNEKLKKINETVKVIDVEGKDIMRHDLLPEMR